MKVNDLKIAFIGVSHWHVPLYFAGLPENSVVAVSDPDPAIAKRFGQQLHCKVYTDGLTLLDEIKPDFVFAFAPHCEMKALSLELIARKVPFTMEKPMGMSYKEVAEIAEAAEAAKAFCAIPFVWRYSDTVAQLKESLLSGKIIHMSYRFIAGPPSRYLATSGWMLSRATAGGGCMTNLGVHFIDMALHLTDSRDAQVLASAYQYGEYDIETYAASLLKLSSGASLTLETGYAYPMDEEVKRENRWTIVTENGYYTLADNCLEAREFGKDTVRIPLSTDSDVYYPKFAAATLDDYVNGRRPRAAIPEVLTVRGILDRMNEAADA
ncbi:MAG: Gfo/Idh/MocA family oxidoreductase [Blautia sp.]|nr:Gfo/Idh/MocA family oxidoreductase [Blautia sp.]